MAPTLPARPKAADAGAERTAVVLGIAGLVAFPAAGAALLADRIGPAAFVGLSCAAVTTFLVALGKLER